MKLETVFLLLNNSIVPAWLLLLFAPRWKWTQRIVHSVFLPLLLGLAYTLLLFTDRGVSREANFFTLQGVMAFFTSPQSAIAGWVHYLVFDLFVGAWEVRDAIRRGINHYLVVPCLIVTLLFGPLGLALYALLRFAKTSTLDLQEEVQS